MCMRIYLPLEPKLRNRIHDHAPWSRASISSMLSQSGREDHIERIADTWSWACPRAKAVSEVVVGRLIIVNRFL